MKVRFWVDMARVLISSSPKDSIASIVVRMMKSMLSMVTPVFIQPDFIEPRCNTSLVPMGLG